ncbi:hypothetical protein CHU93_05855 [Sandarakinorhabdus cyanobacteriorum]|uniref:Ice-binding protein C-terminal domain-containing protein n=1 Tax=Sandarakinorhabdus cyanobacteriorum TaxID=1981098 RepID=A0A255YP69_9SPHN|nr:PEPxxWA-CTERM sorting domain-containing protein [Sandarakinorhabdus cyanobacteriorum]OYQ31016.1 hypothetical protein CHU93_05855 [Sandarakinorhabdus cyanobacteriorum]
MKSILPVAIIVNIFAASPALAAFSLANDNGGDGSVVVDPFDDRYFVILGADNAPDINSGFTNVTTYGTQATTARVINVRWSHITSDVTANWDPGGWFLNGNSFQLTDDNIPGNVLQGGAFQIAVNPGDRWGFYVSSSDSFGGRGILTIATVPEPASWAMLIAGFGLTGATLRRRRAVAA